LKYLREWCSTFGLAKPSVQGTAVYAISATEEHGLITLSFPDKLELLEQVSDLTEQANGYEGKTGPCKLGSSNLEFDRASIELLPV
jgi:hypothetical protein